MKTGERPICDGPQVERLIASMAAELARTRRPDVPLRLVGVRTRGVPLAERLAAEIAELSGVDVPVGAVDITLYRDDLGRTQTWPVLRGTEIPFDIEGADVVLVDDVLFTGRTVAPPSTRSATWAGRRRSAWRCWSTGATASCRSAPTSSASS